MFIWDFVMGDVMDQIIDWFYGHLVGFLGDFFAQMGNMGVELFDMTCLMERYIKAETEERQRLIGQIRRCMDGEIYDNPFEAYYCYSIDDIERFDQILSSFINQSKGLGYKQLELETEVQHVVKQLNHLQ